MLVKILETKIDSVKKAVVDKLKNLRKFITKQSNKGADIPDSKLANFI